MSGPISQSIDDWLSEATDDSSSQPTQIELPMPECTFRIQPDCIFQSDESGILRIAIGSQGVMSTREAAAKDASTQADEVAADDVSIETVETNVEDMVTEEVGVVMWTRMSRDEYLAVLEGHATNNWVPYMRGYYAGKWDSYLDRVPVPYIRIPRPKLRTTPLDAPSGSGLNANSHPVIFFDAAGQVVEAPELNEPHDLSTQQTGYAKVTMIAAHDLIAKIKTQQSDAVMAELKVKLALRGKVE